MAKRKPQEPTGPGTFMILTLVFFVLATVILGVTTYLGFEGQGKLEEAAKAAADKEKAAKANSDENVTRLYVNRISAGTDTPQVREELAGASKANAAAVLDEIKLLTDKLGAAALPGGRNAFAWKQDNPSPDKTIPQIAKEWAKMYQDAETRFKTEQAAHKKTQDAKIAADQRADDQKKTFDAEVAKLSEQIKNKITAMDTAFAALKTEADKKGLDFKKQADEWAEAKAKIEETVRLQIQQNEVLKGANQRLKNPDPSDLARRFDELNLAKLSERMGTVSDKNGPFVNIQFHATLQLVPGQTFVVLPRDKSLVEVIEREKVLEQQNREFKSLRAREAFADNEMIKGMVEVTEVTSAHSARARITHQTQELRDPIAKGDQLFNLTLSTTRQEHVAYAGIVDLDGDGRDDNAQFIKILENNNLKVDAYLDLKTGQIKGALKYNTRFLIIGSDAPSVGNLKVMQDKAKEMGIQMVDARLFLSLIGVKPPKNPAAPAYSGVTLGLEGSKAAVDPDAPPPPVVPKDEKKDEPKKDEPKKN